MGHVLSKGQIGEIICGNLEKLSICSFLPINVSIPALDDKQRQELGTDQSYLHRIFNSIVNGCVACDLAKTKPGPLNHSRWLKTAACLCRLYV